MDRRRRTDAERERQDRRHGESRRHPQTSQRVPDVLNQSLDGRERPPVPIILLYRFDGAEFQQGLPARFDRRQPGPDVLVRKKSDVLVDFRTQASFVRRDSRPRSESRKESRSILISDPPA